MNWTELLKAEIQSTYAVTDKLMGLVGDDALGWKPCTGTNWMTTGQLIKHLSEGCGLAFRAFIVGDWGLPEGVDPSAMAQIPPAEQLPAIESAAEARRLLQEDKRKAIETLAMCDEDRLSNNPAPAPWDSSDMVLGRRLLQMIDHLKQHKGQLFYYLKLQGKPVNTADLWGA